MIDAAHTRAQDPEAVAVALEVARAQISTGDLQEAMRWLRRAADAAFDAGDDRRGTELSAAAADLKSRTPPVDRAHATSGPGKKLPKPTVPTAEQLSRARQSGVAPKPPPVDPPPQPSSEQRAEDAEGSGPPEEPDSESVEEHRGDRQSLTEVEMPIPQSAPERAHRPMVAQALRVAVSRSDDGAVTVRLLDSAGLAHGERDAMLVALDVEDDLSALFCGN